MKAQNCLFQFLSECLPGPSKIPTVHHDHVPQVPRSPDDWSLVTDGLVTSAPWSCPHLVHFTADSVIDYRSSALTARLLVVTRADVSSPPM